MRILITVNKGNFSSIEEAAVAERQINWWDDKDRDRCVCCNCHAAIELKEHLSLVGAEIVLGEDLDQSCDVLILIGSDYSPDDYKAGKDGTILARNRDKRLVINMWGESYKAGLFSAYHWLESLGFSWLLPDSKGNFIPEHLSLKEEYVEIDYDFRTRACYNEFVDDENIGFLLWASRNRMNMLRVNRFKNSHYVKKLGLDIMGGGHEIFYKYLNPAHIASEDGKTYFDLHPEWFALTKGIRSNKNENIRADEGYYTGDNICTSNKEAVSELAFNMMEAFSSGNYKHLEYLNLWAYDNGRWCECSECVKTGNLSRRMLFLAYDINKIFKKSYDDGVMKRRIKLVVPVYHETLEPPDKPLPQDFDYENIIATFFPIERCYAHDINDPVCTESNSLLLKKYNGWIKESGSNYKGEIFIGEYYNVSSFASLPFIFTKTIKNDIPFYYRTGTRHLYYMHISTRKWGMLYIANNLLAALMRNIHTDSSKLIEDMCRRMYPSVHAEIRVFHEQLEMASANSKYLKHYQFSAEEKKTSLISQITEKEKFPLEHCKYNDRTKNPENSVSFTETMEILQNAESMIENLSKKVIGAEKSRVEEELMRFNYGYKVMQFIFFYTGLRMAEETEDKSTTKKYFELTEQLRSELISIKEPLSEMKYECPWYENAYKATWHSSTYEEYRKRFL